MLLIALVMAACNSSACSGASKAPAAPPVPPPPSLTSVEFCDTVIDNLCDRAERCGWATKDECLMFMATQMAPCESWEPDMVCPAGTTYDGVLAHDCVAPMETLSCEEDTIPEECGTAHYCIPTE